MTLREWLVEADMPVYDKEVGWYDMETGVAFNSKWNKPARKQKSEAEERYGHLKIDALKKEVTRRMNSQEYCVNKYKDTDIDTLVVQDVLDMYRNTTKLTKKVCYKIIEASSAASRNINDQLK